MHTHLNFVFKRALHFSTLAIKLGTKLQLLPQHYKPVFFKHFATRMTHPLLKLKHSVLLVMYSMYNAFRCYINS